MNEQIKCGTCSRRFVNNPEKHLYRQKLCPYCQTPYSKVGFTWHVPRISFRSIKEDMQKLFNFFPKRDRHNIFYACPNRDCNFQTDIAEELRFEKFPDKTKETIIHGKPETIVLSYRDIVTCPKCQTHMIRKRGKSEVSS